jgi:hypothetical protein
MNASVGRLRRQKQQTQAGVGVECLELHGTRARSGEWNPKTTLCISPSTQEVLSDEFRDDEDFRRELFANYEALGDRSYPRQMKLQINGSQVLKANVVSLREEAL